MQSDHSILIVDSHPDGRSQLRQVLDGLRGAFPHQVVGEADSAKSAMTQIAALRPSLLLVDTALADMNGIEFARCLESGALGANLRSHEVRDKQTPQLIYVSGSDRFALDAFEVRALDYLLKPVDGFRLLRALARAGDPDPSGRAGGVGAEVADRSSGESTQPPPRSDESVGKSQKPSESLKQLEWSAAPAPGLLSDPAQAPLPRLPAPVALPTAPPPSRRHFAVHERGRLMLVPVDQVIYLKAELKYVTVRTRQREYLIEDSLTALESEFGDRFVRVHRNALVSRACIAGFERVPPDEHSPGAEPHWQVVLRDVPERLAVSRRQWSTVRNLMG